MTQLNSNWFRTGLPLLCSLLLVAHFLRERNPALILVSLFSIPCLFIPRKWAVRGAQLFFILGSVEWIHTTLFLVADRKALDLPWMRMAVILTLVAALTLASALIVNSRKLHPGDIAFLPRQ